MEGLLELLGHIRSSNWGSKMNVKVHDLACHATSFTKRQNGSHNTEALHGYKIANNRRRISGRRSSSITNINSRSSSSIKLSCKNVSYSRPRSPPTVMLTRHNRCTAFHNLSRRHFQPPQSKMHHSAGSVLRAALLQRNVSPFRFSSGRHSYT